MAHKGEYYHHSFDFHNCAVWIYHEEYPYQVKREQGHGGFTLVFYPEERRVGISVCGAKDRFSRAAGRDAANALIERAKQGLPMCGLHKTVGWKIFSPSPEGTSPWVKFMLSMARNKAMEMLAEDYPTCPVLCLYYAPLPKSTERFEV